MMSQKVGGHDQRAAESAACAVADSGRFREPAAPSKASGPALALLGAAGSRDLLSEVRALWAAGLLPADAQGFLSSHPELQADRSVVLDLAYEEYCVRTERGEPVDPEAFCNRFLDFKTALRELISTHRLLEQDSSVPAGTVPACWPQPGDTFLHFALLRELGRGAFARVFLATDARLGDRPVAVKISSQGAAEAETLGRLQHANIVPVYSIHEDAASGLTAVCMPYLGRATLRDVLDRASAQPNPPSRARVILDVAQDDAAGHGGAAEQHSPAPWLQRGTYIDGVCHLAVQLAEALAFAHQHGVYHRDLKPSNVLLTPDGRALLLDFNLAFDARRADRRFGGTLPYMSPEQLRATDPGHPGDPAAVDARSDLFSLGVILYELLAGVHPFGKMSLKDELPAVRARLREQQRVGPVPLRRANPQVDPPLARVVERCLAFDPQDRPQSAAELVAALRKGLGWFRRGCRWLARHTRAALVTASLVLTVGVGVGYAVAVRPPSHVSELKAGIAAFRQHEYTEAVKHFDRVVAAVPTQPWARFARGRARQQEAVRLWLRGEKSVPLFTLAAEDYERANQLLSDGRIMFCLGVCRSYLSHHPEAIKQYGRALDTGFQPAELFNNLGYSHLQQSGPEHLRQARHFLDQAIQRHPDLSAAYHNRGWLILRPDKAAIELAVEDMRTAVRLGPVTAEIYLDAARILARATREDDSWLNEALAYGQLAIQGGYKLEMVKLALETLSKKPHLFQGLLPSLPGTPATGKPSKSLRLVDVLADLPAEVLSLH